MPESAFGFALLGIAILVVLGVAFVIASRGGAYGGSDSASGPPRGVHIPAPSFLPVVLSIGGALMGIGFALRNEDQLANPFLAIGGLVVFVLGILAWVRAANHEWRDVEHRPHDDGSAH